MIVTLSFYVKAVRADFPFSPSGSFPLAFTSCRKRMFAVILFFSIAYLPLSRPQRNLRVKSSLPFLFFPSIDVRPSRALNLSERFILKGL